MQLPLLVSEVGMSTNRSFPPVALALAGAFLLACSDRGAVTDPSGRAEHRGAPLPTLAAQSAGETTLSLSMTFTEPIAPAFKSDDCLVAPEGFCGRGEVIPFGLATETIDFGAACGGACDLRTITLAEGSIFVEETFSNGECRGSCQPNPANPNTGTLTDVIVGGTGRFQGATGTLAGSVRSSGGVLGPQGESQVQLSGTITLTT